MVVQNPPSLVYLIGARASGKSTIGRRLAKILGWEFVETDKMVEDGVGQSIAEIVSEKGWDFFRNAEEEVLREAAKGLHSVISTGGGIVLRQSNCELMKETGPLIYLEVSVNELERRLEKNHGSRPSLTGTHPAKEIAGVLAERESLYKSLATALVNAEENPQAVAKKIATLLLGEK